jgi:hypothetical protein
MVVVTQCVNKDLRKTFHQLWIGLCQSGQMPTDLIFGRTWILPLQILQGLDRLGFCHRSSTPTPSARAKELSTQKLDVTPPGFKVGVWKNPRRAITHLTGRLSSSRQERRTDSIRHVHGKLPAAVGRDWAAN